MQEALCIRCSEQRGSVEAAKRRLWPVLHLTRKCTVGPAAGFPRWPHGGPVALVHSRPRKQVDLFAKRLLVGWRHARAGGEAAASAQAANLLIVHFRTHHGFRRLCTQF